MPKATLKASAKIEAEVRENGRGGWEIGLPGEAPGLGIGNYPTANDALYTASINYERRQIRVLDATRSTPVITRHHQHSPRHVRPARA